MWLSGSFIWCGEDEILKSFCRYWCGTGKAFGVSAFLDSVRHHWCWPKVGTQKENTERGLEVRKIYQQKLQGIVSNIGSRTSSTPVLRCYDTTPVLGSYYASNTVLEESMMQVSFGLTTQSIRDMTSSQS